MTPDHRLRAHRAREAKDKLILAYDPWGDSKGDDHYRLFWDVMIVSLWPHVCDLCFGIFGPGLRHRAQAQLNLDGSKQVRTFRFCPKCCEAMAESWSDDGRAIGARYSIGQKRAKKKAA